MNEVSDYVVVLAKRASSYPAFKKTLGEQYPGLTGVCEMIKANGHKGLREFFKAVRKPAEKK